MNTQTNPRAIRSLRTSSAAQQHPVLALFLVAALLTALASACDDGGGEGATDTATDMVEDTGADTEPDTSPEDTNQPTDTADTGTDMGAPESCDELLARGALPASSFEIHPDGPLTRIHASVAYDGEGIWVVYNLPDDQGNGGFDVYLTRLHCDGTADIEPFPVHTPSAENETDPDLALTDDQITIVWQWDKSQVDPNDPNNLDTFFRRFDLTGTALDDAAQLLETTRDGNPFEGNIWSAVIDAAPDGSYMITGTRGNAAGTGFQTYAQRIASDGGLDGGAIDIPVDPGAFDNRPKVAIDSRGIAHLAFLRAAGVDADDIAYAVDIAADATEPASAPVELASGVAASGVGVGLINDQTLYAVGNTTGQIVVTDGASELTVGAPGKNDFAPGLVQISDDSAALLYFRQRSGIRNDIVVQRITLEGATFTAGEEVVITGTDPAAPYGPALTHIGGDVIFAAWSEGVSPDFTLQGRFVAVPR